MAARRVAQGGRRSTEDYAVLVKIARLFYEQNKTQTEIAQEEGLSQSKVSRLLEQVRAKRIVEVRVVPPQVDSIEEELRNQLVPKLVRRVVVVPGGSGKNEQNLGAVGAQVTLDAIRGIRKSTVRITMSCGQTMRAVTQHLIELLPRERDPQRVLEFYPAALYADHQLDAAYPATLVTMLAIMTRPAAQAPQIKAFFTNLPPGFYRFSDARRTDYQAAYGIRSLTTEAGKADLFIVGIGITGDEVYRRILGQLNVEFDRSREAKFPGEIVYVPVGPDRRTCDEVAKKLVGVGIESLQAAARAPNRQVIAVAGGAHKTAAVRAVLAMSCIDTLVTDESIASDLLRDPI